MKVKKLRYCYLYSLQQIAEILSCDVCRTVTKLVRGLAPPLENVGGLRSRVATPSTTPTAGNRGVWQYDGCGSTMGVAVRWLHQQINKVTLENIAELHRATDRRVYKEKWETALSLNEYMTLW